MQIGVFDSGKGGAFVAAGLQTLLPDDSFHVVNDTRNVPYGSRSNQEVIDLTERAIAPLLQSCPIVVIACNTATMAGIESYRSNHPSTKFVGIEPMIKPAKTLSRTGHITVLATPRTLSSERYRHLVDTYGSGLLIDQPNTQHWARMIEDDQINDIDLGDVRASVEAGSDVIVLACTHYITLKDRLANLFPGVAVLEPTEAISRQIVRLKSQ